MLRDLHVRTDVSRKLHLPIVLKQGSVELVRIQARTVWMQEGRQAARQPALGVVFAGIANGFAFPVAE